MGRSGQKGRSTAPQFATAQDLAELTGIAAKTWYDWAASDRVPHYRFGSAVRFDVDEVVAWARRQASVEVQTP